MAIDTEPRETTDVEPGATADGGLCRLELPGSEPPEDEELVEDEREP
jgi:hypothetical protein